MIKILAGTWKKTHVNVVKNLFLRPTPSRVRETLFNWISLYKNIEDCRVLDLFCGSGILGLESVSRGAYEAILIDNNKDVIFNIEKLIFRLNCESSVKTVCKNSLNWLSTNSKEKFDLVFIDPPYKSNLLSKALPVVLSMLNENGLIYLEGNISSVGSAEIYDELNLLKSGKTGSVYYQLLKKI